MQIIHYNIERFFQSMFYLKFGTTFQSLPFSSRNSLGMYTTKVKTYVCLSKIEKVAIKCDFGLTQIGTHDIMNIKVDT